MRAEGRAIIVALAALGLRILSFSGAFLNPAAENPLGTIATAEDPSEGRGGEGSVARPRRHNLSNSPSKDSGRAFSKDAGVSTIWVGVLVSGTSYPQLYRSILLKIKQTIPRWAET